MKRIVFFVVAGVFLVLSVYPTEGFAERKKKKKPKITRQHVLYRQYYHDPVLKLMKEEMESIRSERDSITAEIKKEWKEIQKKERDERRVIRIDFEGISKPGSPDEFVAPFHFPPVAQYYTGTCWSFSTTSFLESEIKRITGREIKLSDIYTVYWEYVEKARGYMRKRGNQPFAQGSESDAAIIIWKKYGIVPESAYSGLPHGQDRHNHKEMADEMRSYLEFVDDHGYWDEEAVVVHIRKILDRHIGRPPEEFEYDGSRYTPAEFLAEVVRLDIDDYIQLMSTLSVPFYAQGEFDVPDNWRPTGTYYNVPLGDYYDGILRAIELGYTVCIGGDVSEPGYFGFEDAAIVPSFDIPQDHIDQDSREFRFYNKTTTDDHGVHLLAHTEIDGRDWFLIKDSSRSARHGKHEGYYFYRDDYVKLKMLTYMVHRDAVKHLLPKFEETASRQ
ncbi:MAG: peptidase C1 [bacterium]|nr:MAG: peptidase C1 [bacterium]